MMSARKTCAWIGLMLALLGTIACGDASGGKVISDATDTGNPSEPGPWPEPNYPGDPQGPSVTYRPRFSLDVAEFICRDLANCSRHPHYAQHCFNAVFPNLAFEPFRPLFRPEANVPNFTTYGDLIEAESNFQIRADPASASHCIADIDGLTCDDSRIETALHADNNNFAENIAALLPASCFGVY